MWWTALHRGKKEVPIFPVPFADCMIFTKLYHHLTSVILSIKSILYNILCNKWVIVTKGFSGGSVVKNPPANEGDMGLIPGSGRSPEGGNGNPFQYSCLGNPMDRGAWWATVHGEARVKQDLVTKQRPVTKLFSLSWRAGFSPWGGKIPWRRKWHPTPVLLPGKSHGRRSLVGCSPWGRE